MRIGIDVDNTIISYARVFRAEAIRRGLLPETFVGGKRAVREAVCQGAGETAWQALQGHVYGRGIRRAEVLPGFERFLEACLGRGEEVFFVSHKTRHGHHDPEQLDLREAALGWLQEHGFVGCGGIARSGVFFEDTRKLKIARLGALRLDWFVDDLVEVLTDPGFPEEVAGVLLSDAQADMAGAAYRICRNWADVETVVLDGRA